MFFSNQGCWRNDLHPERQAVYPPETPTQVVRFAEDRSVGRGTTYEFGVAHVRGFNGKGFMPFLIFYGDSCGTGDVVYGTSPAAYDSARAQGQAMMERADQKLAEGVAQQQQRIVIPPLGRAEMKRKGRGKRRL